MKLNVLAVALAATALGAFSANAQVSSDHARLCRRARQAEYIIKFSRKDVDLARDKDDHQGTTGSGDCSSKTVHKEDITGSKTVQKTNCD